MDRLKRVKRRRPVGLPGKGSAQSRTMTPFRIKIQSQCSVCQKILQHFMLPSADNFYEEADFIFQQDMMSYSPKSRQSNYRGGKGSVKMPHKKRLEARKFYSKGIVTPCTKDSSQDSTNIVMPSGVSSFLLDCMDLDLEDTLPSIETFRKADTYDEGTALISEDEILQVKNSTLLDLSHAVDIAMQQPPNLSSILELSLVTDVQAAKEPFCLLPPLPVSPLSSSPVVKQKNTSVSTTSTAGIDFETSGDDEKTPKAKRVVLLSPVVKRKPFTGRDKPIKCRKVTFNDIVSTRDITKPQVESPVVHGEPSSEPAKFFDFADERERAAFFQRLKKMHTFHFPAKPIQ